jgi:para-aminobenzoate synthetase/4-amino-4-deoxychorismate lyase
MGVGSGIVYDSLAKDEFAECKLKAKFLTHRHDDFKLIETLLWDKEYKFIKEHLGRLKRSAKYFDFNYHLTDIHRKLKEMTKGFIKGRQYKVRFLFGKEERLESEVLEISPVKGIRYVVISKHKINPDNLFLYHKTTNRALYDAEYSSYAAQGYFDVIFLNTRGEFTEGAISNLIIQKKNRFYTSPVSSGLLAGIYREYLIKKHAIKEQVITKDDLINAERVFLCNSVRGLVEVKIVDKFIK